MQTRCVLYARVSTRDKGQDVENQLRQLREYAERCGYTLTREYVDHASGKKSDRDAFQEMFRDASQRKFDIVIFWSLDRFTREGALPTLQYLNQLSSCGVNWRSLTEQYLDSTGLFRDAVIAILGAIAKQERVRISERVTAGISRAKAQGVHFGNPHAIVDRVKVRDLRDRGMSLRQIASSIGVSKSLVGKILQEKAAA